MSLLHSFLFLFDMPFILHIQYSTYTCHTIKEARVIWNITYFTMHVQFLYFVQVTSRTFFPRFNLSLSRFFFFFFPGSRVNRLVDGGPLRGVRTIATNVSILFVAGRWYRRELSHGVISNGSVVILDEVLGFLRFLQRARSFDTRRCGCGDVRRRLRVAGRMYICIFRNIKAEDPVGFSHILYPFPSYSPPPPAPLQILAVNRRWRCVRRIKGLMFAVADQK